MVRAVLFAQRDRLPELRAHTLDLVVAQCALLIDADRVERARLVELRKNLILEMKGTRRRGRYSSAYAILTSEEGFTGTRADILEQINKILGA